jgi:hypothetical protein
MVNGLEVLVCLGFDGGVYIYMNGCLVGWEVQKQKLGNRNVLVDDGGYLETHPQPYIYCIDIIQMTKDSAVTIHFMWLVQQNRLCVGTRSGGERGPPAILSKYVSIKWRNG